MCGITAILSNTKISSASLIAANDIIHHRGPDGGGYAFCTEDGTIQKKGCDISKLNLGRFAYNPKHAISPSDNPCYWALGHRRLSIIDLSTDGHMPMCDSDEKLWITYNGEIYNYIEIRDELTKLGCVFKTMTDTEVILYAYKTWGSDCMNKFVGMWSFVLIDNVKNKVFAARDRFGIKPLYYWISVTGDLHFGSEIKQFTVLNGWSATANIDRCYDFLVSGLSDHTDETMFQNVFQVPASHYFLGDLQNEYSPGSKLLLTQWYTLKSDENSDLTYDLAKTKFLEHLDSSVKLHLRSDVSIATSLSGGIDSSSILCYEDKLFQDSGIDQVINTFSCCSTYDKYDERKWCDIVVKSTNVNPTFIYPTFDSSKVESDSLIWHQDEPYSTQSIFFSFSLFKKVKESNIKVLLNGQGSDEYLGGYGQLTLLKYLAYLKGFRLNDLIRESDRTKVLYPHFRLTSLCLQFIKIVGLNLGLNRIRERFNQSSKSDFINTTKFQSFRSARYREISTFSVESITNNQLFRNALPRYLHWEDRNSMASSVESRVPFLDHRLIEFVMQCKLDFLDHDGVTKRILRDSMEGILPDEIRQRKDKMGYVTPEEVWIRSDKTDYFRSKLSVAVELSSGFINKKILSQFDGMINHKLPYDNKYMRVTIFGDWLRMYGVKI